MKRIALITDKDILGQDGLSEAKPRLTARAVLKNPSGHIAVMYASEFELYSLPGGGVEDGESVETALRREIYEETGCVVTDIAELGYVEENRAQQDYTQLDYYFAAAAKTDILSPHLTEDELKHGTTVLWRSPEEAYDLIASPQHTTPQKKYLQARDEAALDEYMKLI